MGSGGRLALEGWGAIALTAFVTLMATTRAVEASEPGYALTLGAGASDNVTRSPGGASSTIVMEGGSFTWHDQRPRLNADIDADLQYLTYFPRDVHAEVIGNILADLRATLVPQLVYWDLSENFGQGRVDPLTPPSPLNRENINYFSTGPDVLLPLSASNLLDISAHYGNVTYQTSPLDSTRYSGRVGFIHMMSERTSVSLNVTDERVDFKNDQLNVDYSSQDAFVRFDAHGARSTLTVDLGYDRVKNAQFPASGLLARLGFTRKLSAASTVAFSAGHEFSDAANGFVMDQTVSGANLSTQSTTQTSIPFKSDYATLGWNFLRSRTGFGVGASAYKDTYVQQGASNDTRILFNAQASRQITPTLTLLLADNFYRQNFSDLEQHASENDIQAMLSWILSRRLSVGLAVTRSERHSDIPNTDFTENRVWLTVSYGRAAQLPPGPATPRLPNQRLN
jgi:hypothetical protein